MFYNNLNIPPDSSPDNLQQLEVRAMQPPSFFGLDTPMFSPFGAQAFGHPEQNAFAMANYDVADMQMPYNQQLYPSVYLQNNQGYFG